MDGPSFLAKVAQYRDEGYRLVMINATVLKPGPGVPEDGCEIIWTFEKANQLEHLRERVVPADEVPSVSGAYPFAHLYENEIRELFGLNVVGLNVDWKGQLYRTSQKVPLSPKAIRERLEAAAAAKGAKGKKS